MNPFENKKSKFVKRKGESVGHIELRSLKSERNYKKAKSRALESRKHSKDQVDLDLHEEDRGYGKRAKY